MNQKSRQRDPNKIENQLGTIKVEIGLNVAKGLPETTVAMVQVARAEHREDILRARGEDDYSIPFDRIMDAFDSFISEWSNRKLKTGNVVNYDLSEPRDLTILLLWQIRHIRTHAGGLIGENQRAKKEYESYFSLGSERGLRPIIDLPRILESGHEVVFSFQDYKVIKNAIFDYIAERIPKADLEILQARSSVFDITANKILVVLEIRKDLLLEIDLVDLYEQGCTLDFKTGEINYPTAVRYFPNMNKICFASTGACIPVRIIPISVKKKKKRSGSY